MYGRGIGQGLEGTDGGTSQRDVNENAEETRNCPKRVKNMRVEWTGVEPHERKRSKTRRSTQNNAQT